jgi:hypothetical protein
MSEVVDFIVPCKVFGFVSMSDIHTMLFDIQAQLYNMQILEMTHTLYQDIKLSIDLSNFAKEHPEI